MEQAIAGRRTAEKERREPARMHARWVLFWLFNLYLAGAGGALSVTAGLCLSLLTAAGVLEDRERFGLTVAGLLAGGLATLLWAAHSMDRVAALRIEN